MINVNGTVFFVANDRELWKSDGTSAGTQLVRTFASLPTPSVIQLNGTLFFVADDGTSGLELWKSDGTSSGTQLVRDIKPGAGDAFPTLGPNPSLTNVSGTLYFVASDGVTGYEFWRSDGTSNGTRLVRDINSGGYSAFSSSLRPSLTNVNGTLFFAAADTGGFELWKSTGTAAGTSKVREIGPRNLTNLNGTLFFVADDGTNGAELWKSDGTSTGTVMVKNIRPGGGDAFSANPPPSLVNVSGHLFFIANDGTNGFELWGSDGTANGTVLVRDIKQGNGSAFGAQNSPPPSFTNVNGTLYFLAEDGLYGFELWKSDGTSGGTVMVKDIKSGAGWAFDNTSPPSLTNVAGTLFFAADDGTNGRELWKSNGTDAGTVMVANIRPGASSSNPQWLANVGGILFFQANDGTNGVELWANTDNMTPTTIVSILPPPNGTYRLGQNLDFTVQFSRTVTVDTAGGMPQLQLVIGSATQLATYVSGSGSNALLFRYTVQPNDFDNNGIALVSPLQLNGGTIQDGLGNTPTLTFTPPDTSGVLVDAVVPTIVQIEVPADGIYSTGQNLDFRFRFSKPVVVDTAGGTPRLPLDIGGRSRFATYVSGSGSNTLLFRYTVAVSDFDADGIALVSPLQRNGGTLKDPAGNGALLNFTR